MCSGQRADSTFPLWTGVMSKSSFIASRTWLIDCLREFSWPKSVTSIWRKLAYGWNIENMRISTLVSEAYTYHFTPESSYTLIQTIAKHLTVRNETSIGRRSKSDRRNRQIHSPDGLTVSDSHTSADGVERLLHKPVSLVSGSWSDYHTVLVEQKSSDCTPLIYELMHRLVAYESFLSLCPKSPDGRNLTNWLTCSYVPVVTP